VLLIAISGLLSLGLIWAINACARTPCWGIAGACVLCAGAAIGSGLFVCLTFPAFAVQSTLSFVLLLVCMPFRRKPRVILSASIAAMAASYAFFLCKAIVDVQEMSRLRGRYPLQSIAERLAYETRETDMPVVTKWLAASSALNPVVEQRLALREDHRARTEMPWRHNRRTMLASLHNRKADQFAVAQGFGQGRMMPGFVSEPTMELPPAQPIALPAEVEAPYDTGHGNSAQGTLDELADAEESKLPQPGSEQLFWLHESGTTDFVDPDRTGYVQDRDHVAGFISHGFSRMPEFDAYRQKNPAWQIARLELVSLLKHEVPLAYVSKNLPQMDELRDAPIRPLEEFERTALDRLKSDEDVVIDESPDRMRMIGSLRAAKDCLKCHSVQRGELLGALTYELVPVRPRRKMARPLITPSS
jgi:hypothetical protein